MSRQSYWKQNAKRAIKLWKINELENIDGTEHKRHVRSLVETHQMFSEERQQKLSVYPNNVSHDRQDLRP